MLNVLLAEDSGVMRKIIVRSLNEVGILCVTEAADGQEAFEIFQNAKCQFDLVMTDWHMPNRTGIQLTQDIRAINTDVVILMITTESEREKVVEALLAGANDFLAKPFDADTLREKLRTYMYVED
jgi:two-component system chemotaxis response regulator CheY